MFGNVTLLAGFTAPPEVIGVVANQILKVAGVTVQTSVAPGIGDGGTQALLLQASLGSRVEELRGGGGDGGEVQPLNPIVKSAASAIPITPRMLLTFLITTLLAETPFG
jgi:hypothetical protein